MTSKEIAEKYVYGKHDALTDRQEIKDMIADIEQYAQKQVKNNGVLADVINCPLCGGEMAFVHPENCMTEGCPNCVF